LAAPGGSQQRESDEATERALRSFSGAPDDAQFVVGEDPVAGGLLRLDASHAASNWRQEIIVPAGVPIEELREERQRGLSPVRAPFVLDLVKESDDLGAFDSVDLTGAKNRIDEPLERSLAPFGGTEFAPLALEIFLGDRLEAAAFLPAPLGHRVAAFGDFTQLRLRLF